MTENTEITMALDKVCRTCLAETDNLKSVTEKPAFYFENDVDALTNMLEICTSLQVLIEDNLPKLICSVCEERLCNAFNFRQQAIKSDDTLRNYLNLQQSLQNIEGIKEEIAEELFSLKPEVLEVIEQSETEDCNEVYVSDSSKVKYDDNSNSHSESDPDFEVNKKKTVKKKKRGRPKTLRKNYIEPDECKQKYIKREIVKTRTTKIDPEVVKQAMIESKKKQQEKRECRLCGFISSNARGLSLHISHIHKEMKNRWCPLCYIEVDDLNLHKKTHSSERLHKCTFCDKTFRAQGHLTEHLRSHMGDRPHKCDVCEKRFLSARHLRVHTRIHTGEKPYQCEICSRRFTQKNALQGHRASHTGEKPYKCQVCDERWPKFSLLAKHLVESGHASEIDPDFLKTAESAVLKQQQKNKTHLTEVKIEENNEEVKSEYPIDAKYIATVVKDPVDKTLCIVCGKTFSTANKLRLHMRVHTGETPYRCEYCDKRFSTRGQQVVHVRVHTGEKPHVCHVCGRGFAQTSVLNTHMKLHTGRPEQCSVCFQRFCRPAELRLHMRKHTGEKPYLCTLCGQAFIQSSHLTEHLKTHSDERPYKCPHCDRAFKQNSSLRSHVQIHTGEKPYMCTQCPYACRQSYSLTQHMRQHGGDVDRPHECLACGKRYPSLAMLNAHSRSAHQAVY